mgnify:CR=1 FL=1
MAEPCFPLDELDALIEEALTEEPFLKAPLSLQRGVEARVRLLSLREHERRRFFISIFTLTFLFLGSVFLSGVLVWFTNLSFLYTDGVSGGKGWLDYYATAIMLSFSSYQGAYSLIVSFLLALATFFLAGALQIHKMIYSD